MRILSRGWRVGLALLLLSGTGCLVFEKQTIVAVFPPGTQEVRCLLVYEGLQANSDKKDDIENARKVLTEVFEKEAGFYPLMNLPIELTIKDSDKGEDRAFKLMLGKHMKIHKGAFFLSKEGKLCAYQTVNIHDRDKLVSGLNGLISAGMNTWSTEQLKKPAKAEEPRPDDETLRLIQKASGKMYPWLRLEPGRLSLSLPATAEGARYFKADALRAEKKDLALWIDNPFSFEQRKDQITLSLGLGDGEPIRLVGRMEEPPARRQDAEVIAHARKLAVPFKKELSVERLVAEFLASGVPERKP
jgi:hypothetical protein